MNRCETCKFWKRNTAAYATEEEKRGGFCHSEKIVEYGPYKEDMLVYSYCEDGRFWTGPKFGCVHHEAAE